MTFKERAKIRGNIENFKNLKKQGTMFMLAASIPIFLCCFTSGIITQITEAKILKSSEYVEFEQESVKRYNELLEDGLISESSLKDLENDTINLFIKNLPKSNEQLVLRKKALAITGETCAAAAGVLGIVGVGISSYAQVNKKKEEELLQSD